jgi:hypothetical protein
LQNQIIEANQKEVNSIKDEINELYNKTKTLLSEKEKHEVRNSRTYNILRYSKDHIDKKEKLIQLIDNMYGDH